MNRKSVPSKCPQCRSYKVDLIETEHEDEFLYEFWQCEDCIFGWKAEYEFQHWEPNE